MTKFCMSRRPGHVGGFRLARNKVDRATGIFNEQCHLKWWKSVFCDSSKDDTTVDFGSQSWFISYSTRNSEFLY